MPFYDVTGTVTVRFCVEVEAENEEEALRFVDNGNVSVGAGDYVNQENDVFAEAAELLP